MIIQCNEKKETMLFDGTNERIDIILRFLWMKTVFTKEKSLSVKYVRQRKGHYLNEETNFFFLCLSSSLFCCRA